MALFSDLSALDDKLSALEDMAAQMQAVIHDRRFKQRRPLEFDEVNTWAEDVCKRAGAMREMIGQ